jgi:hypothetical protein
VASRRIGQVVGQTSTPSGNETRRTGECIAVNIRCGSHPISETAVTIVDVHCPAFNADDLPVRGFIRRVHGRDQALGGAIAALADPVIPGSAPGYRADLALLAALLAAAPGPEAAAVAQERDPELLGRAGAALAAEEQGSPQDRRASPKCGAPRAGWCGG